MNLQSYLARKNALSEQAFKPRGQCRTCWQPPLACYCEKIESIDCQMEFVILIHPMEARRRIATGRMSHLCLKNSHLIKGLDFSQNSQVHRLLNDPQNHCVVLYPGLRSTNLTPLDPSERVGLFPKDRRLVVFVVDGTWATVRKMLRLSPNITSLPRICFTPHKVSNFRVRKQPAAECYSTIEAIHYLIELLGPSRGFSTATQEHDKLLSVFNYMVEAQLRFIERAPEPAYRRVQKG